MDDIQVNVYTQVNSALIRREMHNGRDHWVVPSFTLPADVVMNGTLYPKDEIAANFHQLEGTAAPLGHPTVNGQWVPATSAEAINTAWCGAWNRNVKMVGNRVSLEKWIDIEVCCRTAKGQELHQRIEALHANRSTDPIHTSVALLLQTREADQQESQGAYKRVAKIRKFDHDAILLDVPGAATPEQGVGMMVNCDQAVALETNASITGGGSYRERETRISQAVHARFPEGSAWIVDFTDTHVVLNRGKAHEEFEYSETGGVVTLGDVGRPVERRDSWVSVAANALKQFFQREAVPPQDTKEGNMPITPEERADLMQGFGTVLSDALNPLREQVTQLAANQETLATQLTANRRAEEDAMRAAVAAQHGEIVANALSGDALAELHRNLGTARTVAPNAANSERSETGAPMDFNDYFGGAK